MSSGQISVQQRPYSSFRSTTKYSGFTSSPVLLGIRVGSLGSSGKSVRQFAGGVGGNSGKNGGIASDEESKRRVPSIKTCRKLPPDSPTLVTTRWQQSQRPNVTYRVSNRYQQVKAIVDTRWTTSSDKTPPCSVHSKSPNGSSGTSVESIVPKYRAGVVTTGGSQKRAYQTNLAGKSTKFFNNGINSVAVQRRKSPTKRDFHMKDLNMEEKKRSQAFSSKFPQGMPFEDEFFRNRRSNSGGVSSNYSSYSNYERQSSTSGFEDEFHRKPSNEPLYVDFSKSIPSSLTPDSSCVDDDDGGDDVDGGSVDENGNPKLRLSDMGKMSKNCRDDGDFYYSFESGGKQRLIVQNKPMVYVAVASWVPKCNTDRQVVATIGNRSGGSDNSIEEPTTQVKR